MIWGWDAELVEAAMSAKKLDIKRTNIIPETLLNQRQEQGVHLVTCMDGVEGQVWRNNSLINSRWWSKLPSYDDWMNFQRDAGIQPDRQIDKVPTPNPQYYGQTPWGRSVANDMSPVFGEKLELWLVITIFLCLYMATIWQGSKWFKLQTANSEAGREFEVLSQQSAPILEARGNALESLGRLNLLQSLDPYPEQIALMARVTEVLPKDGVHLKEWDFQNGKLKIQFSSPNKFISSDYIKVFQSLGVFKNVQAVSANDPNNLILSMDVLFKADIKAPAEAIETANKKDVAEIRPH